MSEGCKFEVGKIYKCTTGIIAKCLFAYENAFYPCMIGEVVSGGNIGDKQPFSGSAWKEYKEPRTITRWVNVYDNGEELYIFPSPRLAESKEQAQDAIVDADNLTWLATIPVSYTEPR